jgi:hypothetical protein
MNVENKIEQQFLMGKITSNYTFDAIKSQSIIN